MRTSSWPTSRVRSLTWLPLSVASALVPSSPPSCLCLLVPLSRTRASSLFLTLSSTTCLALLRLTQLRESRKMELRLYASPPTLSPSPPSPSRSPTTPSSAPLPSPASTPASWKPELPSTTPSRERTRGSDVCSRCTPTTGLRSRRPALETLSPSLDSRTPPPERPSARRKAPSSSRRWNSQNPSSTLPSSPRPRPIRPRCPTPSSASLLRTLPSASPATRRQDRPSSPVWVSSTSRLSLTA
mmetsp:Transcript_14916/g.30682  ORF Transcript_14916/g.30682 Transcript_14916/m.30682 type:complete len:242 (+) Transcript_14916:832-1557(+)